VDEIAALLDRAVTTTVSTTRVPPAATIAAAARRLDVRRSLVSVTVVVLLVIGSVIGLASTGHASETGPTRASAASAAPAFGADG
jgi:hypothetical protein